MTNGPRDGERDTEQIDLPVETVCDPTRRALCGYLLRADADLVTDDELLEYLVDRSPNAGTGDGDTAQTGSTDQHREAIEAELRHAHLPQLDDSGFIEYDPHSGAAYVDREAIITQLEDAQAAIVELLEEADEADDG